MTDRIKHLQREIAKAKAVLAESKANYDSDPSSYSARLLLMSTENYLGDLLRELELERLKKNK
jgi:hypothetical protein